MSTVRHVVLTDPDGYPTGRARIDVEQRLADGTDENGEGPALYRTARGRVVLGWHSQWANVATRWTADPHEVAEVMADRGWSIGDDDRSVLEALREL